VYRLSQPAAALSAYIEHYWSVQASAEAPLDLTVDVFVDARADLIFNFGAPYTRIRTLELPYSIGESCLARRSGTSRRALRPTLVRTLSNLYKTRRPNLATIHWLVQGAKPMNAKTTHRLFSRETEVAIDIKATPENIWSLLTNAAGYPTWNSTVLGIEGEIAAGKTIKLRSTLDPKRTFKLTVREFQPPSRLAWGDAMGKRTYTLTAKGQGVVAFAMHEKIGGPFFPLFARMIPSFDESFNQIAADLKKKAESMA
jgi:uncharacterized protein YndB with AHSA1/START domain